MEENNVSCNKNRISLKFLIAKCKVTKTFSLIISLKIIKYFHKLDQLVRFYLQNSYWVLLFKFVAPVVVNNLF